MTYAFTFDAAFCSGCKACQAACKDKNDLPLGVLWRRVVEVSGGTWQKNGAAWNNSVFAYNVSIACNHCLHPKCAGVCPTGAYLVREDGIVLLDTEKCMGCGYCAWACPYGAPQYNVNTGTMTKCNFCFDHLDQGLPPVCVAACPLRVLDYEETMTGLAVKELRLWEVPAEQHPYPLPGDSHTQPRLAIKPHAAMNAPEEKFVANLEEIQPRIPSQWEDVPLILFTLLTQMAVGGFWAMLWTFPRLWTLVEQETTLLQGLPLLLIGGCLGAGMLASLAHLGRKKRAWRALGNLRKSWLSREVLFTGLFGTGWLLTTLQSIFWHRNTVEWMALTATLGFGLVYSMSRVYRLHTVPGWNTRRTNLVFIVSALLLGQSLMATLLPYGSQGIGGTILVLLFLQLSLMHKWLPRYPFHPIRVGLILAAMILSIISLSLPGSWLSALIFLIVAMEESIGRWSFYQAAHGSFL
ncbi:MAG TPA: DmsC/YnfH family molybdoenzyme membrane anchor subunit [Anaerolineales bacterium]|nr:DmsC/YnfH family molybdoenzyme membrane anchor subunit [Anaerolineales bacterium]